MRGLQMAEKVSLGIIGTSSWAEMLYLKTLHDCPSGTVSAICGRDAERLADLAARYGIPQTYTDHLEMLDRAELDAVAIVTPDDLHSKMTLAAIERGLHVLCEKPLANSAAEAKQMLEAAVSANIIHMVLFTWRWQPHFQYLKSLIESDTFGRVYRTQLSFITNFAHNSNYQWRLDPKRANGVLGDLGSHMFDLSRWLFADEIVSVSADLGTAFPRTHIPGHDGPTNNDFAHVAFRYASGARGVVDVTNVSHDGDRVVLHLLRIEGERASLELEHALFGAGAELRLTLFRSGCEGVALEIPSEYFGAADRSSPLGIYTTEPVGVRGFVSAVRHGIAASPDFSDGWRTQRVVDAALVSNRERQWIEIPAV
jgi:predicted dehydrogenase